MEKLRLIKVVSVFFMACSSNMYASSVRDLIGKAEMQISFYISKLKTNWTEETFKEFNTEIDRLTTQTQNHPAYMLREEAGLEKVRLEGIKEIIQRLDVFKKGNHKKEQYLKDLMGIYDEGIASLIFSVLKASQNQEKASQPKVDKDKK
ncbi:MAG: hypothetical protein LBD60_01875 [Puniceicoccales bacterium]|jgi:hypothetical protein|nr:hypothetical protein [Puniceicoccales bacterium]